MTDAPMTASMEVHRERFAIGSVYLDDCTVRAAVSASSTVPAGSHLEISGRWPADCAIDFLAEYFAESCSDLEEPQVMDGATIDLPRGLVLGSLPLNDATVRIGPFLYPSGILLRGSSFTVVGRAAVSIVFHGWDAQPQQAPKPKRVVRRILRDELGQVVGSVEEAQ